MIALNRAQLRERIRRDRLGIVTPIEMNLSTAAEGDAPTYQPDPSNNVINAAIEEALSEINGDIFFSGSSGMIPIVVAAQTTGPYYQIDLQTAITSYTGTAQINNVSHAQWTPDDGNATRLIAKSFRELDRDRGDWMNAPVGVPQNYIIDSYNLYIYPAPSSAGTLNLMTGLSMLSPVDDTDTIGQLPADYHPTIMDMAAVRCIRTMIGNIEMQARLPILVPQIIEGKRLIRRWYISQMQDRQDGVTHRSNRPYFTGRRR